MEKVSYCEAKKELKVEIKEMVKQIKPMKTKEYRREHSNHKDWLKRGRLEENMLSAKIRTLHIVYCLLRGRKYEQIEVFSRTEPDWSNINNILSKYESLEEYNERKKSDNNINI